MRHLFSKLAILCTSSRIQPRDEGTIFTTPQDSDDGFFDYPRTYPLTIREGSSINISWTTTFENINLYFYQKGKVANSVQLVTNLATEWYQWEAHAEETNLTDPFVFRVVNAQGTAEDQTSGGFWSTSWYLSRDSTASSSVAPSSSSSTIVPSSSATPSPPITSSEPSSTTQDMSSEATQAPPIPTLDKHSEGMGTDAIIGLTIGLVLVGIAIIAALLFYLRKRRRSKNTMSSSPAELPAAFEHDKSYAHMQPEHSVHHEAYTQPLELRGSMVCYELPAAKSSQPLL